MGSGYNSLKPMAKSENEVAPKLVTVTGSVGDVIRAADLLHTGFHPSGGEQRIAVLEYAMKIQIRSCIGMPAAG